MLLCTLRNQRRNITTVDTINWLLDSDPAISWQTMRDLTDTLPAAITTERARIPHAGIGAEILARQEPNGSWRRADKPVWLSTLFTMLLLRATGVDRAEPAVESAVARLEASLRWNDLDGFWELRPAELGGNPFFEGEVEPCINGGVLALSAYFRATRVQPDTRINEAVSLIKSKRQPDGRWLLDRAYDGALALPFDESAGEPSRWNTLRALRVLSWANASI
jgi:hypothetical protein